MISEDTFNYAIVTNDFKLFGALYKINSVLDPTNRLGKDAVQKVANLNFMHDALRKLVMDSDFIDTTAVRKTSSGAFSSLENKLVKLENLFMEAERTAMNTKLAVEIRTLLGAISSEINRDVSKVKPAVLNTFKRIHKTYEHMIPSLHKTSGVAFKVNDVYAIIRDLERYDGGSDVDHKIRKLDKAIETARSEFKRGRIKLSDLEQITTRAEKAINNVLAQMREMQNDDDDKFSFVLESSTAGETGESSVEYMVSNNTRSYSSSSRSSSSSSSSSSSDSYTDSDGSYTSPSSASDLSVSNLDESMAARNFSLDS